MARQEFKITGAFRSSRAGSVRWIVSHVFRHKGFVALLLSGTILANLFGALIPTRVRNVLAAAKNLGVTHVTNGCYRLHPVEWNTGEAAGACAAFCLSRGVEPHHLHATRPLLREFQSSLAKQGVALAWPWDASNLT